MANNNQSGETILSLHNIDKTFGGTHALADVSFDLKAGEIHALVGENGAGKSTLIKIITGAYFPDKGTIEIGNSKFRSLRPQQARDLGVSVVYQEFNILPELSVAENIFMGNQPRNRLNLIDIKSRTQKAYDLLDRLGANSSINPNELVKNLTVGEQQIVEISKALATESHIIIMDEPSAVLPSRELERLFSVIRVLRSEGNGVIYISHRLNEVFELADRVTVLKDGQLMATKNVAETHNDELVRLMVGRELVDMYPSADNIPEDILLNVKDLNVEGAVFNVNLQVKKGEVLGLAGLGGSGRTTVCKALVGLEDIQSGEINYLGKPAPKSPGAASEAGLVLVPEDRKAYGLVLNQSMRFNLTLPNLKEFIRGGVLRAGLERDAVNHIIEDIKIKPPSPEILAESLSGGNQQKVVVGKWLMTNPKLVIFDEPTRGIDVGAKAEIYQRIRDLTYQGVGVIMASSELPELIGMSDRIIVFHEGRVSGELERKNFSEEAVMRLATATNESDLN
ncbi:MAG: sugar ABC transporter ATP-binding protein [Anaerolineales bacterium]|jgi:ribose transport system ATP-binding protein